MCLSDCAIAGAESCEKTRELASRYMKSNSSEANMLRQRDSKKEGPQVSGA